MMTHFCTGAHQRCDLKLSHLGIVLFGCILMQASFASAEKLFEDTIFDAVVDVSSEPVVGSQKPRRYQSLQAAIDDIPSRRKHGDSYRIFVTAGDYREKIDVPHGNVTIVGEGADNTRIAFGLYAAIAGHYRSDNWGTPGSATFTINADSVTVKGLTIENTFDFLGNDKKPKGDSSKIKHTQGVALLLDINSDRVFMEGVRLVGYQDTLFANGGRTHIVNSSISGVVDFIFGAGQLLVEHSVLLSRKRGKPFDVGEVQGHISAAATNKKKKVGFVFRECRLEAEEGLPANSISLGRPWHPTRTFADGRYADPHVSASVVYIHTYMAEHIVAHGWESMRGTGKDGLKSQVFTPEDARFFEFDNYGPGANVSSVRQRYSLGKADQLELESFLAW